ncbi:MAG: amidohydrolase [Ardenticatenaceae bacterium]|nr:amidohydrolase [Ardenticatenaceae bacterium]HBY98542.1 amidohydrolase [Chloroflexota bacterium]
MRATLLFYNGPVLTGNGDANALAVANSTILAVGQADDLLDLAGPQTKVVDLGGRALLPGFNDAHIHLWKVAMLLRQVDVRPAAAPSIEAIVQAYATRAAGTPPGAWIEGRGFQESLLAERRSPTRYDLDRAAPDHPAFVTRTCGHIIVANSRALAAAGITRETPDPPGGEIDRDEHGEPTGILRERAMTLIRQVAPPPPQPLLQGALVEAAEQQLRLGITSVCDPGVDEYVLDAYLALERARALPIRVDLMALRFTPDGRRAELPTPFARDRLKLDTVKFFADGGLSGATAALSLPYRNQPAGSYGILYHEPEAFAEEVWRVHEAGLRVATHAIGDRTIEMVLDAYEAASSTEPGPPVKPLSPAGDRRHRIEHFGLPTTAHIVRAARLGVVVVPQPVFIHSLGRSFLTSLPETMLPQLYPLRALLDAGCTVALSSDAPVVPDNNPLLGLRAAADRTSADGVPISPQQAVSVTEALPLFSRGGALAEGQADRKGSLTPGQLADLCILSADPRAVPIEQLAELRVEITVLGGRIVYAA